LHQYHCVEINYHIRNETDEASKSLQSHMNRRPWLFDLDVTIYGRTTHCSFVHNGKKVKLMPNQHKPPTSKKKVDKGKGKRVTLTPEKKVDKGKGKMMMNLISHDQLEKSLNEGSTCYALVVREAERRSSCKSQHTLDQYL